MLATFAAQKSFHPLPHPKNKCYLSRLCFSRADTSFKHRTELLLKFALIDNDHHIKSGVTIVVFARLASTFSIFTLGY
jgi:hypothetical protein